MKLPESERVDFPKSKKGPLSGIQVVELGHYYAGPTAALLLADQGATIIRIQRPAGKNVSLGHEIPEQQFRVLNRNKNVIELNLKTEEGKRKALYLIKRADVVIENFRPGVVEKLGLDYLNVKRVNPQVIYLSLPGFASNDSERRHIPAWEGVLGAATGLYTETSLYRQMLGFIPHYTWVPQCSMYGGINGAIAILAALIARERTGQGTFIEVPLAEIGLQGIMIYIFFKRPSFAFRAVADPDATPPPLLRPLLYSPGDNRETVQHKVEHAREAMYFGITNRTYRCGDGREIYINAFDTAHLIRRIVKAVGIERQLLKEGFIIAGPWETKLNNNICRGSEMSEDRRNRFVRLMSDAFLKEPAIVWEEVLTNAGAMAAMVRTREEWLTLKPMFESGVFTELNQQGEPLIAAGPVSDISGYNYTQNIIEYQVVDYSEAQKLFSNCQHKPLSKRSMPLKKSDLLKGLRILDISNVAGGPISGHILAEYGADVIKADPPYYLFPGLIAGSIPILAGKRSILTDTCSAPGREVFERLISWADVVQHNILDHTAERLGVSHKQLQKIKPGIASCQFSAFSGTERGGWDKRPGFDHTLHAATGLMAQYGSLESPQPHGMVAAGDLMGGYCLAFTVLLAAYTKREKDIGSEGRTSLARALNYIQLPYMVARNGSSDWGEARGQYSFGDSAWQRLYQCSDGWIFIHVLKAQEATFNYIVTNTAQIDLLLLESCMSQRSCQHWQEKFEAANIGCHRVLGADDIVERARIRPVENDKADETSHGVTELLRWDNHPSGYPIVNLASSAVRIGEQRSWLRVRAADRLGKHTREILQELGYETKQIDQLIKIGACHEFLPVLGGQHRFIFESSPKHNSDIFTD